MNGSENGIGFRISALNNQTAKQESDLKEIKGELTGINKELDDIGYTLTRTVDYLAKSESDSKKTI